MTLTPADLDRIRAKLRDATAHHSDASWAEIEETIRLARIGLLEVRVVELFQAAAELLDHDGHGLLIDANNKDVMDAFRRVEAALDSLPELNH